jgi:hypothetical protein
LLLGTRSVTGGRGGTGAGAGVESVEGVVATGRCRAHPVVVSGERAPQATASSGTTVRIMVRRTRP